MVISIGRQPTRRRFHLAGRLFAALLLVASAAPAQTTKHDRFDVIEFTNGDHATCEIHRLESGALTVQTVNFGKVEIDWIDVAGIVSPQLFEIRLVDGKRLLGSFAQTDTPGVLRVFGDDGSDVEVPLTDVAGIIQRGSNLWSSRRGHLDVGLNFSSTEGDTQVTLDTSLDLQGKRIRWSNAINATLADDTAEGQHVRNEIQSSLEVPIGLHWAVTGLGIYQRNDDLELDGRVTASLYGVWIPHRGEHGRWGLLAGLAESRENYAGVDESKVSTSAVIGAFGEYYRFGPFGTRASADLYFVPVISESSRYRVELRANFRQKLYRDFSLSLSPFYSFDSHPPAGVDASESWGCVSSVGWSY